MPRIQILELPEGADEYRPPFVLVVDQCKDRWVSRPGQGDALASAIWREVGEQIGARGVIVTHETVEIPANDVSDFVAQPLVSMERAEPFVPDPLRAVQAVSDGGHRFGVPGYLDPDRCAECGIGRAQYQLGADRRTCAEKNAAEGF